MPCKSDHLNPTEAEQHHVKAVNLLFFVYSVLNIFVPEWLKECLADKSYGMYYKYKDMPMRELCSFLRELKKKNPENFESIVYGRSKNSRALADWWEDHCKIDKQRKAIEKKKKKKGLSYAKALDYTLCFLDDIKAGKIKTVSEKTIVTDKEGNKTNLKQITIALTTKKKKIPGMKKKDIWD